MVWGLCVRGSGGSAAENSRFGLQLATLGCSEGQQHLGCEASRTEVKFQGPQVQIPLQHMNFPGVVFPRNVVVQFEKGNTKEVFLDLSSLGW